VIACERGAGNLQIRCQPDDLQFIRPQNHVWSGFHKAGRWATLAERRYFLIRDSLQLRKQAAEALGGKLLTSLQAPVQHTRRRRRRSAPPPLRCGCIRWRITTS